MAYELGKFDVTFEAENIMSEAYVAVELGTNANQVDLPDAVTDTPIGIIQDSVSVAGQSVPVRLGGITKVVAHASFSKGDMLGIAATTGRLGAISGYDSSFNYGQATAQKPIGIALEAAGAAGDIVSMLIRPMLFPWA